MDALILVDLQYDFMPGGALAVPQGEQVVPLANQLAARFALVVASQDWHPPGHRSFASQHAGYKPGDLIDLDGLEQRLWPDHCVQHTHGAELHQDLDRSQIERVFQKGTDPGIDSYSTFYDNAHRRATGLGDFLKGKGVTKVFVMGLATDYCVKFTALDALGLGFEVAVVEDACRGIDANPGDIEKALEEMRRKGAALTNSRDLLAERRAVPFRGGSVEKSEPSPARNESSDGVLGQGRFLTLLRRNRWEYVERPNVVDVVVLIAVTPDGKAVFVEQYREPVHSATIEWPAGLVGDEEGHDGEDLLAAANRELEEESGFRARKLHVIEKGPSSAGMTSEIVTFLRASELEKVGDGGGVPGENIRVHLVPLGGVDAWLTARVEQGLLIDPKVYAGLHLLQRT